MNSYEITTALAAERTATLHAEAAAARLAKQAARRTGSAPRAPRATITLFRRWVAAAA